MDTKETLGITKIVKERHKKTETIALRMTKEHAEAYKNIGSHEWLSDMLDRVVAFLNKNEQEIDEECDDTVTEHVPAKKETPKNEELSLADYETGWSNVPPKKVKEFVDRFGREYGITLKQFKNLPEIDAQIFTREMYMEAKDVMYFRD